MRNYYDLEVNSISSGRIITSNNLISGINMNSSSATGNIMIYNTGASSTSFLPLGVNGRFLQTNGTGGYMWSEVAVTGGGGLSISETGSGYGGRVADSSHPFRNVVYDPSTSQIYYLPFFAGTPFNTKLTESTISGDIVSNPVSNTDINSKINEINGKLNEIINGYNAILDTIGYNGLRQYNPGG